MVAVDVLIGQAFGGGIPLSCVHDRQAKNIAIQTVFTLEDCNASSVCRDYNRPITGVQSRVNVLPKRGLFEICYEAIERWAMELPTLRAMAEN